jgi:hypothetical protein
MPGTDKNNRQQNNNEDKRDSQNDAKSITEALKQAEKDIKKDPALTNKRDPVPILMKENLQDLRGKNKKNL